MVFLALVPSPSYVATQRRELLPRGFTLTFSGGLFSVTASIRLLPSVIYTAGCPFQSGLSSGARTRGKYLPPVAMRRQPRGACGLHVVQTGDLSSFRLLRRHGPGRDGWCRPGISITSVLNQRQIVLPIFYNRACARSCHSERLLSAPLFRVQE